MGCQTALKARIKAGSQLRTDTPTPDDRENRDGRSCTWMNSETGKFHYGALASGSPTSDAGATAATAGSLPFFRDTNSLSRCHST